MHFQKPMLGVPLDWSNPLNDGLVLHLACNEGHGDKLQDLSLNGNHGAINNMAFPSTPASGWNPGRTGVGLNFDGTNDYIDCGNNASLGGSSPERTLEAWICVTGGDGTFRAVISVADGSWAHFQLHSNDKLGVYFYGADETVSTKTLFNSANKSKWFYVAAVWDGTYAKIYVNGIRENISSAGSGDNAAATTNIHIGNGWGNGRHFPGSIDQVRTHNRALTAKEVQDYYINPWSVYMDEEGM